MAKPEGFSLYKGKELEEGAGKDAVVLDAQTLHDLQAEIRDYLSRITDTLAAAGRQLKAGGEYEDALARSVQEVQMLREALQTYGDVIESISMGATIGGFTDIKEACQFCDELSLSDVTALARAVLHDIETQLPETTLQRRAGIPGNRMPT